MIPHKKNHSQPENGFHGITFSSQGIIALDLIFYRSRINWQEMNVLFNLTRVRQKNGRDYGKLFFKNHRRIKRNMKPSVWQITNAAGKERPVLSKAHRARN